MRAPENHRRANLLMSRIALSLLVFTIVAFALKAHFHPEVRARYIPIVILHAGLMLSWLTLLVVQPILVVTKQLKWHRVLGAISLGLVGAMVASGAIIAVNIGRELGRPEVTVVNIAAFVTFLPLYFAAVNFARSKRVHEHRQAMLIATLALMTPAYARIVQVVELPDPVAIGVQVPITVGIAVGFDWLTKGYITREVFWMLGYSVAVIALMVVVLALWFL
ncbi:MAG: hypothetical protein AAGL10_11795 [Pseudomonadota bacterium]